MKADPDGMNDQRAGWAAAAVETFMDQTRTDPEDAVCDLLTDLMHLCELDATFGTFDDALARARGNYAEETAEDAS